MAKARKWYFAILIGLGIMLSGLVWDAWIHATEHAHLVVEALFDPGNPCENPAHIVIAVGLVATIIATLVGFTVSSLEGENWRVRWQALPLPAALWLVMAVAGIVSLVMLAQTP